MMPFEEVVLTMEKANGGEDVSHSYTTSLALPVRSVASMWRSFTRKDYGKNSIEALLDIQNLVKKKWALKLWGEMEPVCAISNHNVVRAWSER